MFINIMLIKKRAQANTPGHILIETMQVNKTDNFGNIFTQKILNYFVGN